MQWTSIFAIYMLFWIISAFLVLPFGVRTGEELGHEMVPGQAESAPGNFRPLAVLLRTTILAAIFFGIFYANYHYGWIGTEDLRHIVQPPEHLGLSDQE